MRIANQQTSASPSASNKSSIERAKEKSKSASERATLQKLQVEENALYDRVWNSLPESIRPEPLVIKLQREGISLPVAAKMLGVSSATISRYVAGVGFGGLRLASWKLGRKRVTLFSAIDEFVEQLSRQGISMTIIESPIQRERRIADQAKRTDDVLRRVGLLD